MFGPHNGDQVDLGGKALERKIAVIFPEMSTTKHIWLFEHDFTKFALLAKRSKPCNEVNTLQFFAHLASYGF